MRALFPRYSEAENSFSGLTGKLARDPSYWRSIFLLRIKDSNGQRFRFSTYVSAN